jgi:hypothetical protein
MSAELELAVEAEVVEPLDQAAASRIDQRIRLLVGTINDNIVKLRGSKGLRADDGRRAGRLTDLLVGSTALASPQERWGAFQSHN